MEEECYICAESSPPPWRSACLCTNRFIHKECLEKLLRTQKTRSCSVCNAEFKNVFETTKTTYHVKLRSPFVGLWSLAFADLVLAVCIANTLRYLLLHRHDGLLSDEGFQTIVSASAFFGFAFIVGALSLLWLLRFRYGFRALLSIPVTKSKVLVVRAPEIHLAVVL